MCREKHKCAERSMRSVIRPSRPSACSASVCCSFFSSFRLTEIGLQWASAFLFPLFPIFASCVNSAHFHVLVFFIASLRHCLVSSSSLPCFVIASFRLLHYLVSSLPRFVFFITSFRHCLVSSSSLPRFVIASFRLLHCLVSLPRGDGRVNGTMGFPEAHRS